MTTLGEEEAKDIDLVRSKLDLAMKQMEPFAVIKSLLWHCNVKITNKKNDNQKKTTGKSFCFKTPGVFVFEKKTDVVVAWVLGTKGIGFRTKTYALRA